MLRFAFRLSTNGVAHIDRISPTTRGQSVTGQNQFNRLGNSDTELQPKSLVRTKGSYGTEPCSPWVILRRLFHQKLTEVTTPEYISIDFECLKHQVWNTILVDSALRRNAAICVLPQYKWCFAHMDRISPRTRGQSVTGQNQSDRLNNSYAELQPKSQARAKGSCGTEPCSP